MDAVKICPVNDAACGELPSSIRCAECKQSTAQPRAVVPAPSVLQQKAPRIGAVLMATELANALAEDGEGVKGDKRTFGHATSALLKQWSAEYFAAQPSAQAERAPVARIAHIGEGDTPAISLVWHVATRDLAARGVVVDALLYVREPSPADPTPAPSPPAAA